ncbi:MAG: flagellar M-ring protein FliF [Alphaproteobacteria bacterium]|nr:flagellar M-ring protein FliF [Alphaproteobacteria bacterium]
MNNLLQTLRNLGPGRLATLAIAALGLVAFFVYISVRLSTPPMALLYSDLELGDSSQIATKLQAMNIPYQVRGDGAQIMVPADQVQNLRMTLAGEGLPAGGSIGYEIFDRTQSLGTSNFVQNVNHLRALEGELARTIKTLSLVKSARVHLVLPQRDLFSRTRQEASASVILRMKGSQRLDRPQIQSVQHLVASAVPGLSAGRISIVDDRGTLLARGAGGEGAGAATATAEEMRVAYESRLARAVEELVERSTGAGKVRAEVTAEFDYDRVTINTETFDPDSQVARSTQSTEENSKSREASTSDQVGVTSNLPEGQTETAGVGTGSQTQRTDSTTNFEISKTIKSQVREGGQVKRLSVAVLVDGTYDNGNYTPRSPEQIEQLTRLVRSAVGFNSDRGDTLEVVNLRFADVAPKGDEGSDLLLGFTRAELLRLGEVVILSIVGLLALLLVVRPLLARLFDTIKAGPGQIALPGMPGVAGRLAGPAGAAAAIAGPGGVMVGPDGGPIAVDEESMIDISSIEGRVKASSLKKIGEIVDKHPEEAVSIVRNWMYQES